MHKFAVVFAALALAGAAVHPVFAQSVTATQVSSNSVPGFYVWTDGFYERMRLPTYNLGFHDGTTPTGASLDAGAIEHLDPSISTGGVRAALGYAIPGTNFRIEFGGQYVGGASTETRANSPLNGVSGLNLNGAGVNSGLSCNAGGQTCSESGTLKTDYQAWSLNGKVATDWMIGSVIVTPSLAIFGGTTRADQDFSQAASIFNGGVTTASLGYAATTSMQWRDIGGRAGLQLRSFVTPSFVVGWGGWVGGAERRTSFSGTDVTTSNAPGGIRPGTSALTLSDSRAVLLANAEANFSWNVTPAASLIGFAGVNYNGDVPGLNGPSYTGRLAFTPTRTAASLSFQDLTSYYAGGGVTVRFANVR